MNKTLTRDRRRILRAEHLSLTPYTIWAVLFILVPLVFVAYYAFTDDNFAFTLENIQRFFVSTSNIIQEDGSTQEVRTYLLIFWRSLKLAIISTAICLVLAYPLAYIMARAKPRTQKVFLTIIMIPMWMNFLIRTYAWMTILQDTGIFNNFLTLLHLPNIHIIGTEAAVIIGQDGRAPHRGRPGLGVQQFRGAAAGDLAPEPARGDLRHHHGADPLGEHLLHLPKAGRWQDHAYRRRDRGAVCGQQPALCRCHRLRPDDPAARLHGRHAKAGRPPRGRGAVTP